MTSVFLVRHAKAERRSAWIDADHRRPLTATGVMQAERLADLLATFGPPQLLSSPFLRCVQTLEPLAERLGLDIERCSELAEESPNEPVLERLATVPDHAVLCSHGDVIPNAIEALARRGARLIGEPNWRKGSVWCLGRELGSIVTMEAWPPPE